MEAEIEHRRDPLSASVLVLNKFFIAVNIVSSRRAIALLFKPTVEVINHRDGDFKPFEFAQWIKYSDSLNGHLDESELVIRTPSHKIIVPKVIRLKHCVTKPSLEVKLTKKNIFIRDDHRCQYCGRKFPEPKLTIDHVIPKSRGGKTTWTNLVTACAECNTKKGGRLPWEARMRVLKQATIPRKNLLMNARMNPDNYRIWKYFIGE